MEWNKVEGWEIRWQNYAPYIFWQKGQIYKEKGLFIRQMVLAETNFYVQKMKSDSYIFPCEKPILFLSPKAPKGRWHLCSSAGV